MSKIQKSILYFSMSVAYGDDEYEVEVDVELYNDPGEYGNLPENSDPGDSGYEYSIYGIHLGKDDIDIESLTNGELRFIEDSIDDYIDENFNDLLGVEN